MSKLYLIITIDTENLQTPLFKKLYTKDLICNSFPKIIEICDSYNVKATFFLSVFEFGKFGKEEFKKICQKIKEKGHDIQLHTHPCWVYDIQRREMYRYTLQEQIRIIKNGAELIKEWTGEYPIAHRAGAYGIDKNTFLALKENNIPIDSSNFYGHPNCKEVVTKNKIVKKYGIIEVPITIFFRKYYLQFGPFKLKFKGNYIKTDIDWATLDELQFFIQEAKRHNIKVMNLFMHSYSFLKFKEDFTKFEPDYKDIEKFKAFLSWIKKDKEIRVITMKEFYKLYNENPDKFIGSNYIPAYFKRLSLGQTVKKIFQKIKSEV